MSFFGDDFFGVELAGVELFGDDFFGGEVSCYRTLDVVKEAKIQENRQR